VRTTQLPVLTPRASGEPEPDLTSLVLTHRAIGQDLDRLAASVGELASAGSAAGREPAVRQYAAALLTQIRGHHRSEDEIAWPVVAAAAGQAVDLAPLTDDHQAIEAAVGRVSQALGLSGESRLVLGAAQEALGELRGMLDEHFADEERQVIPVMRRYLRVAAYRWCERRATRSVPVAALRFRMPWLARYSGAGEMTRVLAGAGARARVALVAGSPAYARLERRAFGVTRLRE
jgi:hypothetical protein